MGNYDKMAQAAAQIFLQHDQGQLLARYPLEHDERAIYLTFLGDRYAIDRATGNVTQDGRPATPNQALSVLDMVCNNVGAPVLTGQWKTMAEVSGASNSPGASSLFEEKIATFSGRAGALRAACAMLPAREVPGGEVSFQIEAFPGFPTWLQFWDADEEFPAQLNFLWDASAPLYLHFETLWYILHEIMDRLIAAAEGAPRAR